MRMIWFAAGTIAGIYASRKARNAAYRLSVPGITDQVGALGVGARAFGAELREGMHAKEHQLRASLLAPDLEDAHAVRPLGRRALEPKDPT